MKYIVILCDGTNNQLETNITNVFRLASSIENDDQQVVFYDPGVGTMAASGTRGAIRKRVMLAYGLAFGVGFTRNLEEAYQFLMQKYEPGDQIYMFGFSRGAFTVRALAGMIHMFGLLHRDLENLIPYVSRAYTTNNKLAAQRLSEISTPIPIHFLGLWDTVSSIGFAYRRRSLPYTANNPIVKNIRHAISIDERRAYFRQNKWGEKYVEHQDIKEVWFPGVHSNVGGGYLDEQDGLGKNALHWMAEEAREKELIINDKRLSAALGGQNFEVDPGAPLDESLTGPWWLLEFLPMNYTIRRRDFFFPLGKPRRIPADATIHQSVLDRIEIDQKYRPPNLSIGENLTSLSHSDHQVEPLKGPSVQDSTPTRNTSLPREILLAMVWLFGFIYFAGAILTLAIPIVVQALEALTMGVGWPPNWQKQIVAAVTWPAEAFRWLRNGGYYFALPMIAFLTGLFAISRLSGLWKFEKRVWGKLIHLRIQGYSRKLVARQCSYLKPDGVTAYLSMLKWDLLFPLVYGPAIWWGLEHTREETFGPWISFLPLAGMVFDWIENTILIDQISRFQKEKRPKEEQLNKWLIRIASVSTILKIVTVFLSTALLFVLVIKFTTSWF